MGDISHCCSLRCDGLPVTDCRVGSNRAVVHTVRVPWRHSACLKGMSMGACHYVKHVPGSVFLPVWKQFRSRVFQ